MKPIDIVLKLIDPNENHEQILKYAWDNDLEEFWIGLNLGTDHSSSFNIKQVSKLDEDDEPGTLTFAEFFNVLQIIQQTNPSEESMEKLIDNLALKANAIEWNLWYRNILMKTLDKILPMAEIRDILIRLTHH